MTKLLLITLQSSKLMPRIYTLFIIGELATKDYRNMMKLCKILQGSLRLILAMPMLISIGGAALTQLVSLIKQSLIIVSHWSLILGREMRNKIIPKQLRRSHRGKRKLKSKNTNLSSTSMKQKGKNLIGSCMLLSPNLVKRCLERSFH